MSRIRAEGWVTVGIVGASLLALSVAACSDSLHLDPPGAQATTSSTTGEGGGSSTTTTTSSAGGGGSSATTSTTTTGTGSGGGCFSNADCPNDAANPEAAICDTYYHQCVECLVFTDCAFRPGTICRQGECACPDPAEDYCAPLANQPARCVDLQSDPADCGSCGHQCFQTCGGGACTDAWEPTNTLGAPVGRGKHVAVWTGTEMVVWGGETPSYTNTGGVYDPATRMWTATSTAGAPSPRSQATAVWDAAHSRMLVWGGLDSNGALGTGAKYDPATNSWATISMTGAPAPRFGHSAVWNGTKMFVFGGEDTVGNIFGDGFAYDPATDTWTGLSSFDPNVNANVPARHHHAAVWTGTQMFIFGGRDANNAPLTSGYAYNAMADYWSGITNVSEPSARAFHTGVWTGAAMLIWGGSNGSALADGAKFEVSTWTLLPGAPIGARQNHSAVWIPGKGMIVWGGDVSGSPLADGALFDATAFTWNTSPMPTGPSGRTYHTAVVTAANKMLVWGGLTASGPTNTGALLDPALVQ